MMLLACTACTTFSISPVDASENKIRQVCIKRNPKVIVTDFTDILQEGFARHGITTKIYDDVPTSCKYSLTYVATQKWDFTLYLSDAHLALYKGDLLIGSADLHLNGGGGLSPSKWDSHRTKMNPMINGLLANVGPQS